MYKRPVITESSEKIRIMEEKLRPKTPVTPSLVAFGPVTINIQSNPKDPKPTARQDQAVEGKLHFATIAFSMEIKDKSQQEILEKIKPLILDQLGLLLGKKSFQDLNSVQGRYVLAAELMKAGNKVISEHRINSTSNSDLISHVYFTQFLVQ